MKAYHFSVTASLLLLSFSGLTQDMDLKASPLLSHALPEGLKRVLLNDKTDEHAYVAGQYVCHNFASQFYLQNSSLVSSMDAFDLEGMASDWGTIITRLADSEKLPLYYVALSNKEHGFYHAINAYLVNPDKPQEIESYIFIEPQTDQTFLMAKQVYDQYRSYYDKSNEEEVLQVSIGTFDAFKNNGAIYQSMTSNLYTFDLKFK